MRFRLTVEYVVDGKAIGVTPSLKEEREALSKERVAQFDGLAEPGVTVKKVKVEVVK